MAAAGNSAQALTLNFDFNSLADGNDQTGAGTFNALAFNAAGRNTANQVVEDYLKSVTQAAGLGSGYIIDMPWVPLASGLSTGVVAEKDYAGEGYVVGTTSGVTVSTPMSGIISGTSTRIVPLTLGNTDYYGTHNTCTTAANCAVTLVSGTNYTFTANTINPSDPSHVSNTHIATLDAYLTNQQGSNGSQQFQMDISNAIKVTKVSFDFEIFPSTDPNPDFTFKFKGSDGKTYAVKYLGNDTDPGSSINALDEDHKQMIGHFDIDTALICGAGCYATALYFIDWPVTIGIDNLSLDYTKTAVEPMTSAVLLSGLGGLWLARRRRTRVSA
jgi:hypothetical protein